MKQVLIRRKGLGLFDVPEPTCGPGEVKIQVHYSAISAGTEVKVVSSQQTLGQKLLNPEMVRAGLNMLRQQGVEATIAAALGWNQGSGALGYSVAGTVLEVGRDVEAFSRGQRVAAAGAGKANHAESANVPVNLVTPVPPSVALRDASTVALGAIALHAVRRASISLGERVCVLGVGILGQLATRFAVLSGARVITMDVSQRRLELAAIPGVTGSILIGRDDPTAVVRQLTSALGIDALIFAAQTTDPAVLTSALALCRRRARCIMLGEYGEVLRREDLYAKEIDFLVSCSYGPGRYDKRYEEGGVDYPVDYVRWTENRNMAEYLALLEDKRLSVDTLIEREFSLEECITAYAELKHSPDRPLIAVLSYPAAGSSEPLSQEPQSAPRVSACSPRLIGLTDKVRIGLIGTGSFAVGTHLPNIARLADLCTLEAICDHSPVRSADFKERFHATYATTDPEKIFVDPNIDAVLVCTRHDSHAALVLRALELGKHVFVEKPLCVDLEELDRLERFFNSSSSSDGPSLTVGFNRRFAPLSQRLKTAVCGRVGPLLVHYRVNTERLPSSHWVYAPACGGRVIGEVCHFVDFASFLIGTEIQECSSEWLGVPPREVARRENGMFSLKYTDGSVACIQYFTTGASEVGKEHIEVHWDGKSAILNDFKEFQMWGPSPAATRGTVVDKGQLEFLKRYLEHLRGVSPLPIPWREILETTRATIVLASAGPSC